MPDEPRHICDILPLGESKPRNEAEGRDPHAHAQTRTGALAPLRGHPPCKADLAAFLFDFGSALADFEPWLAFADHVDPAAATDNLAIGVAVLQGSDRADNLHGGLSEQKN